MRREQNRIGRKSDKHGTTGCFGREMRDHSPEKRSRRPAALHAVLMILLSLTLVGSAASSLPTIGGDGAVNVASSQAVTTDAQFASLFSAPNEGAIARSLIRQARIKANASQAEVDAAVAGYLRTKLSRQTTPAQQKLASVQAAQALTMNDQAIASIVNNRRSRLSEAQLNKAAREAAALSTGTGAQATTGPSDVETQRPQKAATEANLLVLLVDFGGSNRNAGPLYNEYPVPEAGDNSTLYVTDYSTNYYQSMLFSEGGYTATTQHGTKSFRSMRDYYLEQSRGLYSVNGEVHGWYTVANPESYYGDDGRNDDTDNLTPGTPKDLVIEALSLAATDKQNPIDFTKFDQEDQNDLDGDGMIHEPDGIIDHLVLLHAGIDQSAGGGAQGDDAIWAHSSSVDPTVAVVTDTFGNTIKAANYIIQGQDSGIGTFCHEFGHDLGLPDEYDTTYSGSGEPVAFWSIMSSGSWLGDPLDTKPSSISPWGRKQLGWIDPVQLQMADVTSVGTQFDLDQAVSYGRNEAAVEVQLGDKPFSLTSVYDGSSIWYGGGGGDLVAHWMQTKEPILLPTTATTIALNLQMNYNIETYWDYGFIQVSADNGASWKSLSSARTSSLFPADGLVDIKAQLPGYTGNSGGWVADTLDLTPWKGKQVLVRFGYMTDWGYTEKGMFLDNIEVVATTVTGSRKQAVVTKTPLFTDNAANATLYSGVASRDADGWIPMDGTVQRSASYLLEWRAYAGSDATLEKAYQFVDSKAGTVDFYRYEPGLLVWYNNRAYTDNSVGAHIGYGFLGVVDAHPVPVTNGRSVLGTRLQIRDAAFGTPDMATTEKTFTIGRNLVTLPGLPATTTFADDGSTAYWYEQQPSAGLILPASGLKVEVTAKSPAGSVGRIRVTK